MKKEGLSPAAVSAAARGDLENFLVAATPGGIERQEAMGQAAFVGTLGTLPIKCPREQFEALGFKFGEPEDDLFIAVTFPKGWSKRATEHSMWSEILDDKGRKRGSVFYKAAFYDRSAHAHLERRYIVTGEYLDASGAEHNWESAERPASQRCIVRDNADGKVLFKTESAPRDDYRKHDEFSDAASAWLKENFPDNDNVLAYWD